MDYKYIEQILERYWNAETSIEEERILHSFFSQKEVPDSLVRYKHLFAFEDAERRKELSKDFDNRMLSLIENSTTKEKKVVIFKARKMTLNYRLRPLYRAAAIVAVFLMVGGATQHAFDHENTPKGWDYNAANYQDTYTIPQDAFEAGMDGLEDIQDMLRTSTNTQDSISQLLESKK